MKVFVLQHESASGDVKLIGIYASEAEAGAARDRALRRPGFRGEPDGFSVDAYELGRDGWTEGFEAAGLEEPRAAKRRHEAA